MSEPLAMPQEPSEEGSPFWPASDEVIAQAVAKLTRRARKALWHCRRGALDSHDAVMSTLRTYLRQTADGEVSLPDDPDGLWEELERNLKRKLDKVRHSQNTKASRTTRRYSELDGGDDGYLLEAALAGGEPSPAAVEKYIEQTMGSLEGRIDEPGLFQIARMKFESYTTSEIAATMGLSEHQVRRRVSQIRRLISGDNPNGDADE